MVVLVMGAILAFFSKSAAFIDSMKGKDPKAPLSGFSKLAYALCTFVILSNAFQAFFQNGIPPFSGQGSPVRFTMDLSTASERWTTTVWSRIGKGFSLAGEWKIDDSFIPGETELEKFAFNLKSADGAIEGLKPAPAVKAEAPLFFEASGFRGAGNAAGIAWSEAAGEWIIASTQGAVYYADADMKSVKRRAVLDLVNGSDLPYTVDVAWVNDKAITMGRNKALWATRPVEKITDEFLD